MRVAYLLRQSDVYQLVSIDGVLDYGLVQCLRLAEKSTYGLLPLFSRVKVPAGIVIVSPFKTWLCKPCTLAADPSE